jgi:prepilin-type N-terminal cleavage/methylation domain-containing protein
MLAPFRSRPGVTVLELLIAVVVIGILAAALVVHYQDTDEEARLATLRNDLRNYAIAQELRLLDISRYAPHPDSMPGFALSRGVRAKTALSEGASFWRISLQDTKSPWTCTLQGGPMVPPAHASLPRCIDSVDGTGQTNYWPPSALQAHSNSSGLVATGEAYEGRSVFRTSAVHMSGNNFGVAIRTAQPADLGPGAQTFRVRIPFFIESFASGASTLRSYVRVNYTDGSSSMHMGGPTNAKDPSTWGRWIDYQYSFTTESGKIVKSVYQAFLWDDFVVLGSAMRVAEPSIHHIP